MDYLPMDVMAESSWNESAAMSRPAMPRYGAQRDAVQSVTGFMMVFL